MAIQSSFEKGKGPIHFAVKPLYKVRNTKGEEAP